MFIVCFFSSAVRCQPLSRALWRKVKMKAIVD
ncbi:nitrate reductase, partial [Vibrio tarriae]